MASIDRLPVFMQHEIRQLLKRAEVANAEVSDVSASQFWVLRQAVDASHVTFTKTGGYRLTLEGYVFHKKPRSKPTMESADLSDPATDPIDDL